MSSLYTKPPHSHAASGGWVQVFTSRQLPTTPSLTRPGCPPVSISSAPGTWRGLHHLLSSPEVSKAATFQLLLWALSDKNEWVRGRVLGNYHIQKQLESEMPRWQLMRAAALPCRHQISIHSIQSFEKIKLFKMTAAADARTLLIGNLTIYFHISPS